MPDIDINELLVDPDLGGCLFQVVRRLEVVNSHGRPELQAWSTDAAGAIYPTGDNSLVRADAYSAQTSTIQVVTQFRLRGVSADAAGNTFQPDLVAWHGSYYVVNVVNDYAHYGPGFVLAECTEFPYNGPPPQEAAVALGQLDFSNPSNSGLVP